MRDTAFSSLAEVYIIILRYSMEKFRNLEIVYLYFLEKSKDPRLTITKFLSLQNAYESDNALCWLISDALKMGIISPPEIFCNTGLSVEFLKPCGNQLELLKECKKDPKTTYAIALRGDWDFVRVRKGASDIKFADRVIPTYPSNVTPHEISIDEKGTLQNDPYPHGWDEIDWEVYYLMKDPSISYTRAIRKSRMEGSGLSRQTIKRHFEKILKDCKLRMNFFPRGYKGYEQVFLTFRTEYEIGLYESLKKLDRTSFLWKVQDFIVLNLFVDRYCATVRRFKEMEENGLIRDLKVSIPNRHYTPFEEDFD
jgi:hypothetical protein